MSVVDKNTVFHTGIKTLSSCGKVLDFLTHSFTLTSSPHELFVSITTSPNFLRCSCHNYYGSWTFPHCNIEMLFVIHVGLNYICTHFLFTIGIAFNILAFNAQNQTVNQMGLQRGPQLLLAERSCCCSEGVTSEKVDRSDSHCRCCSVHMTSQCLPTVRLLYAPLPQWKFECLPDSLNKT